MLRKRHASAVRSRPAAPAYIQMRASYSGYYVTLPRSRWRFDSARPLQSSLPYGSFAWLRQYELIKVKAALHSAIYIGILLRIKLRTDREDNFLFPTLALRSLQSEGRVR